MGRHSLLATLLLSTLASTPLVRAGDFVGIPDQEFATYYRSQHESQWCWASCIEMALGYEGIELPQETIVTRTLGGRVNLGGLPRDIVASATGVFLTRAGAPTRVAGEYVSGSPAPDTLYARLTRHEPVIILYKRDDGSGHAVVLTGMDVAMDPVRGISVDTLHVYDPSPRVAVEAAPGFRIYPAGDVEGGLTLATDTIDGIVLINRMQPPMATALAAR